GHLVPSNYSVPSRWQPGCGYSNVRASIPNMGSIDVHDRRSRRTALPARAYRALIGALLSGFLLPGQVLATDWRGIAPARSSKDDVRSRLGKPTQEGPDRMEFETRDGKTVVFFYTEQDTQSLKLKPSLAGKVLTIYYYPKKPAKYDLK